MRFSKCYLNRARQCGVASQLCQNEVINADDQGEKEDDKPSEPVAQTTLVNEGANEPQLSHTKAAR